ncbi:tail fiber domain-containing protein [Spirosoma koreense]
MKQVVLATLLVVNSVNLYAQVGIGTTTPKAFLNVPTGRTVLFGQDTNQVSDTRKLIWYGSIGAFRAGIVVSNNWSRSGPNDFTNVGDGSFATGYNTKASGTFSFVSGYYSVATGYSATALGQYANATGYGATALGYSLFASGQYATALGAYTNANGEYSTAMGTSVETNSHAGSFIIGDKNLAIKYRNSADNQMMMRFGGGYMLYSNNPGNQATAVGVQLPAGGNAWTTISDSTRKENFRKADGASFLQKIATMRLGSWNYKGQDAHQYRHYGPMAQDFFAAFGHDQLGTIGEDKSINQADFDGVNLIAIQALIREVNQLKAENAVLRQQAGETASLKSDMEQVKKQLATLLKQ